MYTGTNLDQMSKADYDMTFDAASLRFMIYFVRNHSCNSYTFGLPLNCAQCLGCFCASLCEILTRLKFERMGTELLAR
jgi:hypothetical protein